MWASSVPKITALEPPSGTWVSKQPMPEAVLDAGGKALGAKLYVVACKTSAGQRFKMDIYDPATDSWRNGPSLPPT